MLDTYANETYGRSVSTAVATGTCVACGRTAHPFGSPDSTDAYVRWGLCEPCQARQPVADYLTPLVRNRQG